MVLDPQAQKLLDAGKGLPPLETLSVEEARARLLEAFRTKGEPENVYEVKDLFIPGRDQEILVRVYTPGKEGPYPITMFFHGGGGVVNSIDTHDAICRTLTNSAECIVVSVDYRLAPENKYPVPLNDCYDATVWVAENSTKLNGDKNRLAVGGDSSGGGLAAGVALLARDKGDPNILFQVLIYPLTDYYNPGTSSYITNGTGYSLTKAAMVWFYKNYLPDQFDRNDQYLFPLKADELSGLPPALVITGEYDPLRDEGEFFAKRLHESGVSVGLHRYEGMMHGFVIMSKFLDKGKLALQEVAVSLRAAFTQQ